MIRLENVSKIFGTGVAGLSDINLLIDRGEFVFLVGHTGSGKTTMLRLIVRDMLPTEGTIVVSDLDVVKLPANKIPHLRKKVGVVFQDLKLLMDRTILENILLPMQVAGFAITEGTKRAEELLQMVGLIEHKEKFPVQLSGGELQRVAIARALALSPEILLADEPTGNLDPQTAKEIVDLLEKINEMGTTIVMATHNLEIVNKMGKRVVGLEKGKLIKDEKGKGSAKQNQKEARLSSSKDEVNGGQDKHHEKTKEKDEGSEVSKESKDSKEKENTEDLEFKMQDSSIDSSASSQTDTLNREEKLEEHNYSDAKAMEHKKETKKLSDLLARARQSLHRGEKHKESKEDGERDDAGNSRKLEESESDMPFGFSKEEDVAKKEEKSDDKKESSSVKASDDKEGKNK